MMKIKTRHWCKVIQLDLAELFVALLIYFAGLFTAYYFVQDDRINAFGNIVFYIILFLSVAILVLEILLRIDKFRERNSR